ncbi:hypothetical protein [Bacteroides sp. 224]|uniref:hypothetical protein n=1 Tax=Bacteroides sp. 224 TaxID=2302936 RepID=UPI0013D340F7|nr:hypothetical protein [Bacteroides sp. 224]NDV66831.1 hypothetical protein [Bacteroides sp. 224]
MKFFFKYSILVFLLICLHVEAAETWNMHVNEHSTTCEQQFIAYQAQTTRQAINNFYNHCPNMSCDLAHNTSQDVPSAKYVLRATNTFGKSNSEQDSFRKKRSGISIIYSSDPNSYYVFGLRKIVV